MVSEVILTALYLLLLPVAAGARNDASLVRTKALWLDSRNAAGLLCSDPGKFNTAALSYDWQTGGYRMMTEGQDEGTLRFDTQGAVKVGKTQLWGRFDYDNVSARGTRYNCLVYDPSDERYIYGVADTTESTWKRQCYDMEFKLAHPLVADRLFAGLDLRYSDKIAAKQQDPRAESYNYTIDLKPSLALSLGQWALGFDFSYAHSLERSAPSLSNTQIGQTVFMLRGLGNYTEETVGSGGLETMFYTTNAYGGAMQFSFSDRTFWQAGAEWSATELRQSSVHPRPMGQSAVLHAYLDGSLVLGRRDIHKLSFDASLDNTRGTEYSTKSETGVGWAIAAENAMSRYLTADVTLSYDGYFGGDDWKWNVKADAGYVGKKDRYLSPVSVYSWNAVNLDAAAFRRMKINDRNVLKAGLSASSVLGLGASYDYQGARKDSRVVTEWYAHDIAVRGASAFGGGLSLDWGILTAGKVEVHLTASASSLCSTLKTARTVAVAGIGLVF